MKQVPDETRHIMLGFILIFLSCPMTQKIQWLLCRLTRQGSSVSAEEPHKESNSSALARAFVVNKYHSSFESTPHNTSMPACLWIPD